MFRNGGRSRHRRPGNDVRRAEPILERNHIQMSQKRETSKTLNSFPRVCWFFHPCLNSQELGLDRGFAVAEELPALDDVSSCLYGLMTNILGGDPFLVVNQRTGETRSKFARGENIIAGLSDQRNRTIFATRLKSARDNHGDMARLTSTLSVRHDH